MHHILEKLNVANGLEPNMPESGTPDKATLTVGTLWCFMDINEMRIILIRIVAGRRIDPEECLNYA